MFGIIMKEIEFDLLISLNLFGAVFIWNWDTVKKSAWMEDAPVWEGTLHMFKKIFFENQRKWFYEKWEQNKKTTIFFFHY